MEGEYSKSKGERGVGCLSHGGYESEDIRRSTSSIAQADRLQWLSALVCSRRARSTQPATVLLPASASEMAHEVIALAKVASATLASSMSHTGLNEIEAHR